MKKVLSFLILFLGTTFVLSALQGSLYFSPIPLPSFWVVCMTYYAFRKSLFFTLLMNIPMAILLTSFTLIPLGQLLFVINLIALCSYLVKEHFHTDLRHISTACGISLFTFLFIDWFLNSLWFGFHFPEILMWLGMSLSTAIFAFPFCYFLEKIDQKLEYERVDTLENLRV